MDFDKVYGRIEVYIVMTNIEWFPIGMRVLAVAH